MEPVNHDAFSVFYAQYAPPLWGLIIGAKLPLDQAEMLLVDTLISVWHRHTSAALPDQSLLLSLIQTSCEGGLPLA